MYELQKACLKLHFSKQILVTVLARPVLYMLQLIFNVS